MTLPLWPTSPVADLPTKKLRIYQERGKRLLRMHIEQGKRRILAVGPTGLGKMVMIADITKSSSIPTMFVAHRMELIDGCAAQIAAAGLTNFGVMRGSDERVDPNAATQICSIQTLARRDKPFLGREVLIHIDEAHRAGSDSYIEHIFQAYPQAFIIGWTATPVRLDQRPLGGDLFEVIEVISTYHELLKNPDWLATPLAFATPFEMPDLSKVRVSGSDFDDDALAAVMHNDRLEGNILTHFSKWANKYPDPKHPGKFTTGDYRRTFVFACNIAHSESLAAKFEACGFKTVHVDGKTPEHLRRAALADLGAGRIAVVCNCNVLLEGVDVPEAKCVVHARPTQSITLWRQSCGRIMRPWNRVTPIIIDHAGNWDRLGCPFEDLHWSLTNKPSRIRGKLPMKVCKGCYAYIENTRILCPYCGYEFKKEDQPKIPGETDEELTLRQAEPDEIKKAFFWRQVVQAKTQGFRPGYASAIFKDRYGAWPPREWSDKVKAEYEIDAAWKAALERRLKKKEARQKVERAEEEAMQKSKLEEQLEGTIEAMDPVHEEETFSEWWKNQQ